MALLRRYLTCLLFPLALAVAAPPRPDDTATFKTLIMSGQRDVVGDLFYDCQGRQVRLSASTERLSRHYPIPTDGKVSVYREAPAVPPSRIPLKIPVTEINFKPGGPWVVLFVLSKISTPDAPPAIQTKVLDASIKQNPPGTINVHNFCRLPVALQADERTLELNPGDSRQITYPVAAKTSIWLKSAVFKSGQWSLEISGPQAIVPGNTRALWLIYEQPGDAPGRQDTITLRNFIELLPPASVE